MIPLTFHFAFYRGVNNWQWRDIHTLCLKSCLRNSGATRIIVHYDRDGDGVSWDQARALPLVEWRQVTFNSVINCHDVTDQCAITELYKLQTLWEEGGFFCDLDFVFLRAFDTLRDTRDLIGTQCKQKQKLALAIMGSCPGSPFIQEFLDLYRATWVPGKKFTDSPDIWNMAQRHQVTFLNRPAFYPVAMTNRTFWTGGAVCLRNSYAVHLWHSQRLLLTSGDLRLTVLKPVIEAVVDDLPTGTARALPPVILTFD